MFQTCSHIQRAVMEQQQAELNADLGHYVTVLHKARPLDGKKGGFH